MSKIRFLIVMLLAVMVTPVLCIAQDSGEKEKPDMQKCMSGMAEKEMSADMCPMQDTMKKKNKGSKMVATEDGGVVLLRGNKLTRYDKNLNLKREVELKIDLKSMENKIKQMKENCLMCKKCAEEKKMDMCPKHSEKIEKMMKVEILALEDGGVLIKKGNKLVKYDKHLNFRREIEIEMKWDKIKGDKKACPMSKN